jgi:PAS domain S-box-containing protein
MLGYSPDEIKDLTVTDIHHEEHLPHVVQQFEKQAKGEFSLACDIPVTRKSGSVF